MEKCGPTPTVGETNPAGRKTKTQHQTFPGPCTEMCLCVQGAVRRSTSVNIEARVLGKGPANQIPNLSEKGASEGVANGLGLAPAWPLREAESSGGREEGNLHFENIENPRNQEHLQSVQSCVVYPGVWFSAIEL